MKIENKVVPWPPPHRQGMPDKAVYELYLDELGRTGWRLAAIDARGYAVFTREKP
jgi:hypothetical protein